MRRLVLAAALAAAVTPLAAHATPQCLSKVLLERHDGYTVVNVPTGRCSWTAIVVPVGI
jgi:hypothetical protein